VKSTVATLVVLLGACSTLPKGTHGFHELGITLFLPAAATARSLWEEGKPKLIVVTLGARTLLIVEPRATIDLDAHAGAKQGRMEMSGFDGPSWTWSEGGGESFDGEVIVRKLTGDSSFRFTYANSTDDAAIARWIIKEAMLDDRPPP
jgi:hypothetical protein